jgi:hypothetical protein
VLDGELQAQSVELVEAEKVLRGLGFEAFAMIPSNLVLQSPRWLLYYALAIREPGGRTAGHPSADEDLIALSCS